MSLIELSDYHIESPEDGALLKNINFCLESGERIYIKSDMRRNARLFLRALATLVYPSKGYFYYLDKKLDLSDYRNSLEYKKKVGYIASDVSLISNKNLKENLLLSINYFGDTYTMTPSDDIMFLCKEFGLDSKLDAFPARLDIEDKRLAVITRELSKKPDIILIDGMHEFLSNKMFEAFKNILTAIIKRDDKVALVYHPIKDGLAEEWATRKVTI